MTHTALYPGSFDPITLGHLDVIRRGRQMFDRLIVGVGSNPGKQTLFTLEERAEMAQELVLELVKQGPGAEVVVRAYSGLTVDFARANGATVLLRGVRNLSDLQYEIQQALTNRQVAGLETAFIVAGPDFAYTSSSLIRQITALGDDPRALASFCPESVITRLWAKKRAGHEFLTGLKEER